jgi:hypothetical protein
MNDSRGAARGGELINLLPKLFDPTRTKPLEIFPGHQDLVKDINPAAILAEYPDMARSISRRTVDAYRRIELNDATN